MNNCDPYDQNRPAPRQPESHERIVVVCDADLEDIIPEYLERKREECLRLRELAEKGDLEEICTIAHGLKGSGGCYGFPVISEIGRVMEIAAKTGTLSDVLEQTDALEAYLSCVEVQYG